MSDITGEIDVLSRNNVHIKDRVNLSKILQNMHLGGLEMLQVVSDFDKTITKQHENGVPHLSSFGIFSSIPSTAQNETYQKTVKSLRQKYYPIEMDPHISVEDKLKHMEMWWDLSEKAIKGLKVTQEEIDQACLGCKSSLRDGCEQFFKCLFESNIPVLVFSAGCGDVVLAILKQSGVCWPNVKVISNFLKFTEEGTILGFKDKVIHVFNKNEYALKDSDFYNEVANRGNAIVLGDSLGDAEMTQGMAHCVNVLKIGFLYDHVEHNLPQYMDTFDIVLVDDQTMDVPRAVFEYIKKSSS
ncbi:7-methylguanosine phosphate-specific 5'-nucleotidase [Euwallacea fornicatus]|uniref:7-methylguanosine phosphate-specific 5'-nucleotidase n=1 Tax=Euwallacea fornicatus TaxID=995702 RepID=UPI00338F2E22